jgi:hypothetical protein
MAEACQEVISQPQAANAPQASASPPNLLINLHTCNLRC